MNVSQQKTVNDAQLFCAITNSPIHQFGLGSYHTHTMHTSSLSSKYHSPIYYQFVRQDPSTHLAIRTCVADGEVVE